MWTKHPYGEPGDGYWSLTNGHMDFEVHPIFDCSGRREQYPDGVIVSPEQADAYADQILTMLNEYDRLQNDSFLLQKLMAAGVDNWDGYEQALEEIL